MQAGGRAGNFRSYTEYEVASRDAARPGGVSLIWSLHRSRSPPLGVPLRDLLRNPIIDLALDPGDASATFAAFAKPDRGREGTFLRLPPELDLAVVDTLGPQAVVVE